MTDLLSEKKEIENKNLSFPHEEIDIKEITYNGIELFILKQEKEIFVALKKLFNELGLEVSDHLEIFEENPELINFITKISVKIGKRNRNIAFINISALSNLLDKLEPQKTDVINYYQNFKNDIVKLISDEFMVSSDYLISKAYVQSLNTIIEQMESENKKLKGENIKLKLENDDIRNKADSYDSLLSAKNLQDMKQVANVFGIGRNKFFELLRKKNILIEDGEEHNMPYQKYINAGYFMVRKVIINRSNGKELKTQTLVTPRGLGFLSRVFRNNAEFFQ